MKKIAILCALVSGIFAFSQNGEKLPTLNGKIASANLIEEIKNKKGFAAQASRDGIFRKYTFPNAHFDAISLKRLNEMNGVAGNTPIVIDNITVADTNMEIFLDRFAVLEKKTVDGKNILYIFSKTNQE